MRAAFALALLSSVIGSVYAQGQTLPHGFQDGASDRQAWEGWFNSLTGDTRAGAEYWAGQRSQRNPGPCERADALRSDDAITGCVTARQRLSVPDIRRKAEPDYRQGWNSAPDASTVVSRQD